MTDAEIVLLDRTGGEVKLHHIARMAAACQAWLEALRVERGASPNTISSYRLDLKSFLQWLLDAGVMEWSQVSTAILRGWLRELVDSGLSRATVKRRLSAAKSFWRFIMLTGETTVNPFWPLSTPKGTRRFPRFMEAEDVRCLLESITGGTPADLRDAALLALVYVAGLRVAEVTALRITDVLAGSIRVMGKGSKERLIPIPPGVGETLRAYMREVRPHLLKDGSCDVAFFGMGRNRSPRGLDPRSVRVILRHRCEAAGIAYVNPHGLRHSIATHLLDGGADIESVRQFLGHASISTTQIYLHTSGDRLRRVVERSRPDWLR